MIRARTGKSCLAGRGLDKKSVLCALHERDGELEGLDALTHEEMSAVNVLGARVLLWIVGQVHRRHVLSIERGVGSAAGRPSSEHKAQRCTASLVASEDATISASHEESATVACF
eukprot:641060-Pleurochrysis_carterae.AAC.4